MKTTNCISRDKRHVIVIVATVLVVCLLPACGPEAPVAPVAGNSTPGLDAPGTGNGPPAGRITGSVQVVFRGGNGNDPNESDGEKLAFVDIAAHEPTAVRPGHGTFTYTVSDPEGNVHRQIVVVLEGGLVDPASSKAWYLGAVASDTKGCAGNGSGGHDAGCAGGGCSDDHDHVDGGCSGTDGSCGADHDHVEGGCSGSGGSGGCASDHDHVDGGCGGTDGGCASDHDHVEGGCSGSDGHDGGHDGGCSGSSGSCGGHDGTSGGGNRVNGRTCRVGQVLVGKAHDGGTPGPLGDGITWKWFDADDPSLPSLDDITVWPHLCGKTILAGNIVVHAARDDGSKIME